jgi:hypothetical protein
MEIILARPENKEQLNAIKAVLKALNIDYITKKETGYNPEFVEKIRESRNQAKEGKLTKFSIEDLWN